MFVISVFLKAFPRAFSRVLRRAACQGALKWKSWVLAGTLLEGDSSQRKGQRPVPRPVPSPLAPTWSRQLGARWSGFVEPHACPRASALPQNPPVSGAGNELSLLPPPPAAPCLLSPCFSPNRRLPPQPELPPLVTQSTCVHAAFPAQSEWQLKACKAFGTSTRPVGPCRNSSGYRPSLSGLEGVEEGVRE